MPIFLVLKEAFCSVAAQRAQMLPEQPAGPTALLRVPYNRQHIRPSILNLARVIPLRFITLNYLQCVVFTSRKARPWKPGTTQSEAPWTPAYPQRWFCPSPGHSTTKHSDCMHPAPSDSSHWREGHNSMDKISTAALPASLSEEVMQSRMRQQSTVSLTSFIHGFARCFAVRN